MIAEGALFNPDEYTILRPQGKVCMDAHYIISTVGGLYGRLDPEGALRLMKKHLANLDVGVKAASASSRSLVGVGRS